MTVSPLQGGGCCGSVHAYHVLPTKKAFQVVQGARCPFKVDYYIIINQEIEA